MNSASDNDFKVTNKLYAALLVPLTHIRYSAAYVLY